MSKKLLAIVLSIIMTFTCIPYVYADSAESVIYTQEFMDCVEEYVEQIGTYLMKDDAIFESTMPDGKVVLYYKGLKIYQEENDRVVFGLSDCWCTVSEEVIGDYVFMNPSFFGFNIKENKTGLCVYEKGEIFSIREAVEKGIMTADELAKIIPFTEKTSETKPLPTIAPKPSEPTIPEVTETEPTDDYFEPLPSDVNDLSEPAQIAPKPTEKPTMPTMVIDTEPTEGRWEDTQPVTLPDDVEIKETEPTEVVSELPTEPDATEKLTEVEQTVPMQQFQVDTKNKTIKKSKVEKRDRIMKDVVVANCNVRMIYKKIKKGSSKYLEINRKTGAVTVKKGTPKGVHRIKVKVSTKERMGAKPVKVVLKIKVK